MDLAYKYQARNSRGAAAEGIIYGPNRPLAIARLKRLNFSQAQLRLDPTSTLSGMWNKEFNQTELSRFYTTVGRRMQNGKPMADGLDAAIEYVADPRLRQAIATMKEAILDGQNEFQAMASAGFPKRDAMVVRSTAEAGKTAAAFQSLGKEIQRVENLRKSVKSIFHMPKMMAVLMALFIWAALTFIAPMTMSFLKQTNLKMDFNVFISTYFELATAWAASPVVFSVGYFGAIVGLIVLARRPEVKALQDHIKILHTISVKADMASLWNSFSLLYDAAIPTKESARIVGEAARRPDSRQSFLKFGKLIESGRGLDEAVSNAGFPNFVVTAVRSASSSGDTAAGLIELASDLEQDVVTLTEMLKENVKLASTVIVGLGLLLVFVMTYYPMLASVMSNI